MADTGDNESSANLLSMVRGALREGDDDRAVELLRGLSEVGYGVDELETVVSTLRTPGGREVVLDWVREHLDGSGGQRSEVGEPRGEERSGPGAEEDFVVESGPRAEALPESDAEDFGSDDFLELDDEIVDGALEAAMEEEFEESTGDPGDGGQLEGGGERDTPDDGPADDGGERAEEVVSEDLVGESRAAAEAEPEGAGFGSESEGSASDSAQGDLDSGIRGARLEDSSDPGSEDTSGDDDGDAELDFDFGDELDEMLEGESLVPSDDEEELGDESDRASGASRGDAASPSESETPPSPVFATESSSDLEVEEPTVGDEPTSGSETTQPGGGEESSDGTRPLLDEAYELMRAGDDESARDLVRSVAGRHPESEEARELLEEIEARRGDESSSEIASLSNVPRRCVGIDELSQFDLDHRTGFVFSLVDGEMSFDDILELSSMSRDETIDVLRGMKARNIIEVVDE